MKKILNWVLAATLCICGASVFTSCTNNDDNPAGPDAGTPAIAMIGKIGHVDYFKQIESAFFSACEENDVEALYYTTASENTHQEQIAIVNELKQLEGKQLKGIIYVPSYGPNGESADSEVAAFAQQRGIPVIIMDTELKDGSPLAGSPYFGTDNAAAGRELAAKVVADKVAVFAQSNSIAQYRAEAFKTVKPGATLYPVGEEASSAVEAVIDEYDDFVFFNGHLLSSALDLLKKKGKNVYTFDAYEEFLDELIAGNTHFKGIMAQNTFGMARKAVEAVLAGAKQGEMVPTFYVTRDNLNDDAVKPFLEFYQIDAPAIDNLAEKLVGKWIYAESNGQTLTTNTKSVFTFTSDGSALKASISMSLKKFGVWANRYEPEVKVDGRNVTMTAKLADGSTSVMEMTDVSVSGSDLFFTGKATLTKDGEVIFSYGPFLEHFTKSDVDNAETNEGLWEVYFTSDDPEFESPEPTRELYRADGTCTFYELVDEQWVEDKEVTNSEYFIDGPMLFIRWQESEEMMYENWEVVSSENGKQVNKSVRKHDDGSTYTIYANLTKVE